MAEAALRIVQNRMVAQIAAAFPALSLFVDRPDDRPLDVSELPAVVCRCTNVELGNGPDALHQMMHMAVFQFDCHSGGASGQTIDQIAQGMVADIVAALHEDRTLGGRIQGIEETGISGMAEDGADTGIAILEVTLFFFTPRGDFRSLVGIGGALFTD